MEISSGVTQLNRTSPALLGEIGCFGLLVPPKAIVKRHYFSSPTCSCVSGPKYQKVQSMFFNLKLMQHWNIHNEYRYSIKRIFKSDHYPSFTTIFWSNKLMTLQLKGNQKKIVTEQSWEGLPLAQLIIMNILWKC